MMSASRTDELARLRADNEALRRAVRTLHEVAELVHESLEFEPTCYGVLTSVTAGVGLGLNRAMLFLADPAQSSALRGVMAVGPDDEREADRVWRALEAGGADLPTLYQAGLRLRDAPGALDRRVKATHVAPDGDNPIARAYRERRMVIGGGTDDLDGLLDLTSSVTTPLLGHDGALGVLYADNRFTGERLGPVERDVFARIADHAAWALETVRHYERISREARTDALTGLGHHGAVMAAVAAAVNGAARAARRPGLVMLDLDDFKAVNDALGHLAGDTLLAGVAGRLKGALREGDTAFRYGGEEFAVLVEDATQGGLAALAERIRRAVGATPVPLAPDRARRVTCSVGYACLAPGQGPQGLIDAADQALLAAKADGKDRVVGAP
jgi:diguanylate cyclase (GGDEF)-like protein